MKISTKGRYALRLMIDLAENKEKGYITLGDIAERQNISKKYLEQIVPVLTSNGILKTSRGFQGGYRLAKAPCELTVGEVLRLTEGSLSPVACLEGESNECPRCVGCATLPVWKGLERVINEYLDSITVRDVIDGRIGER